MSLLLRGNDCECSRRSRSTVLDPMPLGSEDHLSCMNGAVVARGGTQGAGVLHESGPLKAVHVSRHTWPGRLVK